MMTDYERLRRRITDLSATKDSVLEGLSPEQIATADTAFDTVSEELTGLFIDDDAVHDADGISPDNMKAVAKAARMYADILDVMSEYHPADILRLFNEGLPNE